MDTCKLIENKDPAAEARDTQSGRSTNTVKLVDMGAASVETKGFVTGVEVGYTPRS